MPSPSPSCRFCAAPLRASLVDLGMSPLCQTHIAPDQLEAMEPFYPLHARVCESCFLVQLPAFVAPQAIFGEYAYFSSYSASWVEHARRYALMAIERFELDRPQQRGRGRPATTAICCSTSCARGIPVLGIEPAANVARVGGRARRPDRRAVLRSRHRPALRRGARHGRPGAGQQRAGARARPQRLRGRPEGAARARAASSRWSSRTCCG